jgi:hypothetical protein
VTSVHKDDVEAARLQNFEDRDPVDAGGFHRHMRHPTRGEPIGEPVQIAGKRGERTDRRRVPIGWNGDEVFGRATVDPGGVRMETFEGIRRGARLQ